MPRFVTLTADHGGAIGINVDAVAAVGNPQAEVRQDWEGMTYTVWVRGTGGKEGMKYTKVRWADGLESLLSFLEGPQKPKATIAPTATPTGLRDAAGHVVYCPWCPNPNMPDPGFHPDGEPEHREPKKRS